MTRKVKNARTAENRSGWSVYTRFQDGPMRPFTTTIRRIFQREGSCQTFYRTTLNRRINSLVSCTFRSSHIIPRIIYIIRFLNLILALTLIYIVGRHMLDVSFTGVARSDYFPIESKRKRHEKINENFLLSFPFRWEKQKGKTFLSFLFLRLREIFESENHRSWRRLWFRP